MAALVSTSAEMALASLADSTVRSYSKIIQEFKTFVLALDKSICVFPVSAMHIAIFMSKLYRQGAAPASIATKLSALAFWHQIYFMEDPTSHFMVRRILLGMRKSRPVVSTRPPLTFSDLYKMYTSLTFVAWTPFMKKLVWAMIILSFHAFLRAGEMTKSNNTLMLNQVEFTETSLKIRFKSYKHSKGKPVMLKLRSQNSILCPVTTLKRYITLRGTKYGYLFCQVDGAPVSYAWYRQHFRELVNISGLDPDLSTHSARIGAATFAAASGIPEETIKRMGRWASSAVKNYIKLPILCF